ncbi:UDP-N-acetylmuramate--L-alanine ligase-like [Pyrus x bretschneideri]|uniref:UDP-N-acetylmuramate--L-alanine ligase-like n=1 Tax=Pyrus x bretschneideri TaxID=225117 RepID=UPI00202ED892|nr:UDP-N-acetylmuramate--L-alanine ligase-like [Pyrus x bretschneideri]
MEFPAMSTSKRLHFPANIIGKPKIDFQIFVSESSAQCKRNRIAKSVQASSKNNSGSISISPAFTDESDRESDGLRNEKGWIHFVGIGGCGLSALAMLALKQGYEVSGSDIVWSSFMDGLQEAGAFLYIGHSVTNLQRNGASRLPDAIVVSSAIPQNNAEILYAKSVGVPVYRRDQWLGKLTEGYNLIAVSGSHGKSTTASMLAYVLDAMGDSLTAVVGAHVPQFSGGNIIFGDGRNFVLEADEYDHCFLGLSPSIAVVTNLDWEHVDIFPNKEAVKSTFRKFLNRIRVGGHLILCGDSQGACSLLTDGKRAIGSDSWKCSDSYNITTYGTASSNEWHASSIGPNLRGGSDYTLCHCGHPVADISLQIPGVHNVLNSLAVVASVIALFSDQCQINNTINLVRLHLNNFIGISRRFEMIGTVCGCHIYDDYAHHPTEVSAVIQAARQRFPVKSLLVVFQPHTYSRLTALKDDFTNALRDADQVVVTEVYAAREKDVENVGGRELAATIIGPPSEYIPSLDDVVEKLASQICKNPHGEIVVFTLGAGNITTVGPKLLYELRRRLQVNSSLHHQVVSSV